MSAASPNGARPAEEPSVSAQRAQSVFVRSAATPTSGCPVTNSPGAASSSGPATPATTATNAPPAGCPTAGPSDSADAGTGSGGFNALNVMPQDRNAPHPEQQKPLATERAASTIPIADASELPPHQQSRGEDGRPVWLYPSEQMFYNAMRRKGWSPSEDDMPVVVKIHNAVNEKAWAHVMQWERLHAGSCGAPKLLRFRGRPRDYSPRAMMLNALGYKLPFDRHDWVVDRCGTEVRYVIDFYSADAAGAGTPAAMHLDVRPALDSVGALVDRARMAFLHFLSRV